MTERSADTVTRFLRTDEELSAFITERIAVEDGPMFMGFPDRWYEPPGPKWRCQNDHVSQAYLGTDKGPRCLGCPSVNRSEMWLTFPEDQDGPPKHYDGSADR